MPQWPRRTVFLGVPEFMAKIVVVVAEEHRLRNRFIPKMLHRNGGECALLVRLSGELLFITPVNQGFIVLVRGLRS